MAVNDDKMQTPMANCGTGGSRESATTVLRKRAQRMHEEACGLTALADEVERMQHVVGMTSAAEEALWRLVIRN